MIVTIIFALLSIFVIIFTSIYLNKQKEKLQIKREKRKGKKTIKNIWNIDEINENVIVSGNKKTIIMKIGSIDYHLLSEKEQRSLELNLVEISKTIKYPLQFFSTTEFVDTTNVIDEIKYNLQNNSNYRIVEYGNKIINHLSKLMENHNLVVRKNYVVLSTYGEFEKSRYELISSYENLRFNLLNAKIQLEILSDIEIIELLHRELNKNTTTKIENILQEGGLNTYVRGKNKSEKNIKEKIKNT